MSARITSSVLTLEPIPLGTDPGLAIKMFQNLPLRDVYAEEGIDT
jgi:hypothetical protein